MKKTRIFILMLLALLGISPAQAAEVSPYTVDFDTQIVTSAHDFAVASNWGHLVATGNYDGYGPYYMSYSYYANSGVGGTGCLSAGRQYAGDNWGGDVISDLLITPEVKGTVTLDVKQSGSSNSFVEFYLVTGQPGAWVQGEKIDYTGGPLSQNKYTTVTLNVSEYSRIGIRASYAYLDNFVAEYANVVAEKKISIATAEPSATTGTIYWEQQASGKVLVKYTVTVKNTGEADLTKGEDGYSVSVFNRKTGDVYVTTPVPQDLAVGETSAAFDVQVELPTTTWPNSYTYYNMDLRENLTQTVVQRAQSHYVVYEPKFVFRTSGSTSTSSITDMQGWGTITESVTKHYEIYNSGTAALTVKSITLPEGFTSDNMPEIPAGGLQIDKKSALPLDITLDATQQGTFAGTLSVVYVNAAGSEVTYQLGFSATVISANTWTADFNNTSQSIKWPSGSMAENGIRTDYTYSNGSYDYYLRSYTSTSYATENNKFVTPKLHAQAGDKMAFDVARDASGSDYSLKVYVSADRKAWGEPVLTLTYDQLSSGFATKTVTFDAEGDYYVGFAVYGVKLDNIVGLEKVDVTHDLFIKSVTQSGEVQSGQPMTVKAEVLPLTTETADSYSVKYYVNGEAVATAESVAMTASATLSQSFNITYTPETGGTFQTYVAFEFEDGTVFRSENQSLKVICEPELVFFDKDTKVYSYKPSNRSAAIDFGTGTKTGLVQQFDLYNWGTAPLTVRQISVPEGFAVTPTEATVASKERQTVDVSFTATEPGSYQGELTVTWINGGGRDSLFTLPIKATLLDPEKFYASFDDGANNVLWPAGSTYQRNVSASNGGTYSVADYYITSSNTEENLFITPKLSGQAGDKIQFEARLYNDYWAEGAVHIYVAATRNDLMAEDGVRTEILAVSGENDDEAAQLTLKMKTFEAALPEDGEFYLGFAISGRAYVDNIYGLKVASVAHDWMLLSTDIPAEAMQNVNSTATLHVLNVGLQDEQPDGYTLTAYVDGVPFTTQPDAVLPMVHQLSAAGTALQVPLRSPKVGTYPVYIEVKAGDYTLRTETVSVSFTEEQALAEALQVGTKTANGRDFGFVDWYQADGSATRYTDILYSPAKLAEAGLKAGDQIARIAYRAISDGKSIKAKVTSWVGLAAADITPGQPDKETMNRIEVYDGSLINFAPNFESVIDLSASPLTWDGTSSLRVYTETEGQGSGNWLTASYDYDKDMTMYYNSATEKAAPLVYLTLVAKTAVLTGRVTDGYYPVANAQVVLVSTDGDNIQYAATTDEQGRYTVSVVQANRTYDATAQAEGFLPQTVTIAFEGETLTQNFALKTDDSTTGIAVRPAKQAAPSVIDLQGRRVTGTPRRGLYIINGRKTVVR